MDRQTEQRLLREIGVLDAAGEALLTNAQAQSPITRYTDNARFEQEQAAIFRRYPTMAAHSSELAQPGAFICRQIAGLPILLTRDQSGQAHAFINVCRHRGAELVSDASGCRHRFTCPYHAWTWGNDGNLLAVPHESQGFPDLDRNTMGLVRVPSCERYGWLWLIPEPTTEDQPRPSLDLDAYLLGLGADLDWLGAQNLRVAASTSLTCAANWKVIVEGGIESYHFQVAHRDTIGPYFHDNLSTYEVFGSHFRSVLPRKSTRQLPPDDEALWYLREHANVLYSFMPSSQLLVQQDHIVWIQANPQAVDSTALSLFTLAPDDGRETHWERNHDITMRTLTEDFDLAESIQRGFTTGANAHVNFGRFEGALTRFHGVVDGLVSAQDPPIFMQPGDVVRCEVESIGAIENKVVTPG